MSEAKYHCELYGEPVAIKWEMCKACEEKHQPCTACGGSGQTETNDGNYGDPPFKECDTCEGSGMVYKEERANETSNV